MLALRVEHVESVTPRVRKVVLGREDGGLLPSFTPGAHIEVHIPTSETTSTLRRAYSLVRSGMEGRQYEIAVQLEPNGRGGSAWIHQLALGQNVTASLPKNQFPLVGEAANPLLIAAGIGVTPIMSMALYLNQRAMPFDAHVVARDREQAAYVEELDAMSEVRYWFDNGDPAQGMPLHDVMARTDKGRHLHVCGPKGFIAAVFEVARTLNWPEEQLHCELFTEATPTASDTPFRVTLALSGQTLDVASDQTILQAMEDAGLDPMFDCRRGDCGICIANVVQGHADHRDICLTPGERESGSFCICVSRAHSDHLVLEL